MGQESYARDQVEKLRSDLAAEAAGEQRFASEDDRVNAIFRTWVCVEATNPSGAPREAKDKE